jgi:hypothetical protein
MSDPGTRAAAGDGNPVAGGHAGGRHGPTPAARLGGGVPLESMPDYKGGPLDAERGPGLGCFWIQVVALVVLVVLTPAAVVNNWPDWLNAALLIATLILLLFVGQTLIFLLRLVAAESRGRRRPLSSATRTVGELEDTTGGGASDGATGTPDRPDDATTGDRPPGGGGPAS